MLDAESAHPRVLKDPPTADSAEVGSGRISASYQRQKSAAATAFSGGDGQVLQFVIPSEAPPRGRRGIHSIPFGRSGQAWAGGMVKTRFYPLKVGQGPPYGTEQFLGPR